MSLLDIIQLKSINHHRFLVNKSLVLKHYVVLGIIVMVTAGRDLVRRGLMAQRMDLQPHHVLDYVLLDFTVRQGHQMRDRWPVVVVACFVPQDQHNLLQSRLVIIQSIIHLNESAMRDIIALVVLAPSAQLRSMVVVLASRLPSALVLVQLDITVRPAPSITP